MKVTLVFIFYFSKEYFYYLNHVSTTHTILFPPRRKMVTALLFWQPSMTSMCSFVVPKLSSRTFPALPSFSGVSSLNLGTIRPPVAIAINWENKLDFIFPEIWNPGGKQLNILFLKKSVKLLMLKIHFI